MVLHVERLEAEPREVRQRQTKRACRLLAETMQKPSIGLRDNRQGRMTSARRMREEFEGRGMEAIRAVEKGDEDTAVQESRVSLHGRGRP